jgi:hypothetical protein
VQQAIHEKTQFVSIVHQAINDHQVFSEGEAFILVFYIALHALYIPAYLNKTCLPLHGFMNAVNFFRISPLYLAGLVLFVAMLSKQK